MYQQENRARASKPHITSHTTQRPFRSSINRAASKFLVNHSLYTLPPPSYLPTHLRFTPPSGDVIAYVLVALHLVCVRDSVVFRALGYLCFSFSCVVALVFVSGDACIVVVDADGEADVRVHCYVAVRACFVKRSGLR
jgi:hypothetical protein